VATGAGRLIIIGRLGGVGRDLKDHLAPICCLYELEEAEDGGKSGSDSKFNFGHSLFL